MPPDAEQRLSGRAGSALKRQPSRDETNAERQPPRRRVPALERAQSEPDGRDGDADGGEDAEAQLIVWLGVALAH
jgi:hypothetical protein